MKEIYIFTGTTIDTTHLWYSSEWELRYFPRGNTYKTKRHLLCPIESSVATTISRESPPTCKYTHLQAPRGLKYTQHIPMEAWKQSALQKWSWCYGGVFPATCSDMKGMQATEIQTDYLSKYYLVRCSRQLTPVSPCTWPAPQTTGAH